MYQKSSRRIYLKLYSSCVPLYDLRTLLQTRLLASLSERVFWGVFSSGKVRRDID